jgi:hypothetical protein
LEVTFGYFNAIEVIMEEDKPRPGEGGSIFIYSALMAVMYLLILLYFVR